MKLPNCVVCGEECIPLADYDMPTCVKCDDAMALVLERAQFRIPFDPHCMPDVTGCGTPAGYLEHYRRAEEPCAACSHFWDVALKNIAAWQQLRRMREGTLVGLPNLQDSNPAKPSRTRTTVSPVHGAGVRGELRADPGSRDREGNEVSEEEVPVGIVKAPRNKMFDPSPMVGQTSIFDEIRDQISEAV